MAVCGCMSSKARVAWSRLLSQATASGLQLQVIQMRSHEVRSASNGLADVAVVAVGCWFLQVHGQLVMKGQAAFTGPTAGTGPAAAAGGPAAGAAAAAAAAADDDDIFGDAGTDYAPVLPQKKEAGGR